MARYHLIAINADPNNLDFLSNANNQIGGLLDDMFLMGTTEMSLSGNERSPRPIVIDDREVGVYIGHHYDGKPTGDLATPPLVSPNHVVFTHSDSDSEELNKLDAKSLVIMARSFQDEFNPDLAKATARKYAVTPILINDTLHPTEILTLKTWTYQRGEEHLMQRQTPASEPFKFIDGHHSPRRVSEYAEQPMPTASPV